MSRMVYLGGEVRSRALFRGDRHVLEWAGLAGFMALALGLVVVFRHPVAIGAGILLAAAGWWMFTPRGDAHQSWAAATARTWYHRWRNATGLSSYHPDGEGAMTPWWLPATAGERNAPLAVGEVRWFDVEFRGGGSMVVFRHAMPDTDYFSVVLEVTGSIGAVRAERDDERPYVGWGEFLTSQATERSAITVVQEIAHVVPADIEDHLVFIGSRIPEGTPEVLQRSYADLAGQLNTRSEQHRTYLALGLPSTDRLWKTASRYGGGDTGIGIAVFKEVQKAVKKLRGPFGGVRVLDEARAAALIRALQDPGFDIDQSDGVTLATCWQASDGTHPERVVVNGTWLTRTATVQGRKISTEALPVQALSRLVSGGEDSFIRTISAVHKLVPAARARGTAQEDVTVDTGETNAGAGKGRIDDGSAAASLSGSTARLNDLKVGSPYHGVNLALYITVKARTEAGLEDAVSAMEAMANAAGISELSWMDERQDLAMITTLPLARGVKQ
ncbi:hypothetical protein [Arthrobacter sp. NyZ413]|uniref:hypothetical protein n=1 Tax=Arthrobacter sp. NyZ413 TaxID=3144669 RepID=UPI003BF7FBB8